MANINIFLSPSTNPSERTLVGTNEEWQKVFVLLTKERNMAQFVSLMRKSLVGDEIKSLTLSLADAERIQSLCGVTY